MGLAKELAKILRPLVGHSPYYIKKTQAFVEQVISIRMEGKECITIYDVEAQSSPSSKTKCNRMQIYPIKHPWPYKISLHCWSSALKHTFPVPSILDMYKGQQWGLPSAQLWPTISWMSLKSRPSALPPTCHGYGSGMWMSLLLSKRQNTVSNLYSTSTPLTLTYSSLQRTVPHMAFRLFGYAWTKQHTYHNSLQET